MNDVHIYDEHYNSAISVYYNQPKPAPQLAQHIIFSFITRDGKRAHAWFIPNSRWTIKVER